MHSCIAKFQEHCFNISRNIVYSVFSTFQLQTVWRHHWSDLHNRKMSISLKRKKIFQKEKCHSSVFWNAFQISTKKFSFHRHFKGKRGLTLTRTKGSTKRKRQLILMRSLIGDGIQLTCIKSWISLTTRRELSPRCLKQNVPSLIWWIMKQHSPLA